jgi:hypothetical protein
MWLELDLEELEREEHSYAGERSPDEIEAVVTLVRLELYNKGEACGPRALRKRLAEHYNLKPLPSERTISRILAKQGLTGARTGHYPGDVSH